jgi:hypothetical protein
MSITFLVASWSSSVNGLVPTLSSLCEVVNASKRPHNRADSCTIEQTLGSSHRDWHSGHIRTLLVEIFENDVGDKGKYLMRNIGSSSLTGSLGSRLWIWAQWLDRTCDREDEASFELHGIRRRKGMVYIWTINDWLVVGTIYVYGCKYCTSHKVMTLTHDE